MHSEVSTMARAPKAPEFRLEEAKADVQGRKAEDHSHPQIEGMPKVKGDLLGKFPVDSKPQRFLHFLLTYSFLPTQHLMALE